MSLPTTGLGGGLWEGRGVGRVRQRMAGLGSSPSSIIYGQCGLRHVFNLSDLGLFLYLKEGNDLAWGRLHYWKLIEAYGMWQFAPVFSQNVSLCGKLKRTRGNKVPRKRVSRNIKRDQIPKDSKDI